MQTIHFKTTGPANTAKTLSLAGKRAKALGIKSVLVASTSGATGVLAAKQFKGKNLVVISHSTGFKEKDRQEFKEKHRKEIERLGGRVLTCQHALGGVNRAVRRKYNTTEMDEIIAHTLRLLGQGFKVSVEISLMAADAGLISTQEEAIAIGGSDSGADTAIVLTPANAHDFFELKVHEVLCKPRL